MNVCCRDTFCWKELQREVTKNFEKVINNQGRMCNAKDKFREKSLRCKRKHKSHRPTAI